MHPSGIGPCCFSEVSGAKTRYCSGTSVVAGKSEGRKWMSLRLLYISISLSWDDDWCRSARDRRIPPVCRTGILLSIEIPGSGGDVILDSVSDIRWMCFIGMEKLSAL